MAWKSVPLLALAGALAGCVGAPGVVSYPARPVALLPGQMPYPGSGTLAEPGPGAPIELSPYRRPPAPPREPPGMPDEAGGAPAPAVPGGDSAPAAANAPAQEPPLEERSPGRSAPPAAEADLAPPAASAPASPAAAQPEPAPDQDAGPAQDNGALSSAQREALFRRFQDWESQHQGAPPPASSDPASAPAPDSTGPGRAAAAH